MSSPHDYVDRDLEELAIQYPSLSRGEIIAMAERLFGGAPLFERDESDCPEHVADFSV